MHWCNCNVAGCLLLMTIQLNAEMVRWIVIMMRKSRYVLFGDIEFSHPLHGTRKEWKRRLQRAAIRWRCGLENVAAQLQLPAYFNTSACIIKREWANESHAADNNSHVATWQYILPLVFSHSISMAVLLREQFDCMVHVRSNLRSIPKIALVSKFNEISFSCWR